MPLSGTLIRVGLWILLILGTIAVIWWGIATVHNRIYKQGVTAERAAWEEREAELSARRNEKLRELEDKLAATETAHAKAINAIGLKHTQELEHANVQKARDIAAARAGTLKLRIDKTFTGRGSGGSKESDSTRPTGICDGQASGELPPEITANLFDLANDADINTNQLDECQKVIEVYRKSVSEIP